VTYGFGSWRGDSNPDLLFTRQLSTVHGVLARAVLAAQVGCVVQPVLVYGLLTALYTAGVTTLGSLLSPSGDSSLAIAASTLVVAALFQPARRRIRNLIDRRFNRRRYDAIKTVALFSSRLRDQLDLDDLTGELLAVVNQTMEPANASLWLRPTFAAAESHAEPQAAATGRSPSPALQRPE
jgi:hypothetical protein